MQGSTILWTTPPKKPLLWIFSQHQLVRRKKKKTEQKNNFNKFFCLFSVHRHPNSKFYEPNQRDCQHHLPYASGCGYLISKNFANFLANPPLPFRFCKPRKRQDELNLFFFCFDIRLVKNEDVAIGFYLGLKHTKKINCFFIFPQLRLWMFVYINREFDLSARQTKRA